VSLPDGNGGLIHIEHLIFTAKGLVILDVKTIDGIVFASDSMTEWTSIAKQRRFAFRNPQPALLDRVAALRLIAKDVPVSGYVVFMAEADFSKGRPTYVIKPEELRARYAKPGQAELERVIAAFSPQWERVVAACEPSFRLAAS
ncbi:MAG TPA: nuclease-related domain-containing protein, partial [Gammaproteobacteria bacterium]|nr:nuclease-related domain-containing protein [Gammaproteobacteria bacterium]